MRTLDDIKKSLEATKQEWIKKDGWLARRRERRQKEKSAEQQKMTESILKDLRELKACEPEQFEKLYWETSTIVIKDNIFNNSYSGIVASLALLVSGVSMLFTAVGSLEEDFSIQAIIIEILIFVMLIMVIAIMISYLFNLWKTRTHSYYHFLLAAAEDVRNTKEEK